MPEIVLQPAAAAGVDSYIREDQANTNFGNNTRMHIYYSNAGDNRDAFVKFDLSSIAKGSKIQEAA